MKIAVSTVVIALFLVSTLQAAKIAPSSQDLSVVPNASATSSGTKTIKVAEKTEQKSASAYDYSLSAAVACVKKDMKGFSEGKGLSVLPSRHHHSQTWNPLETELKEVQQVSQAMDRGEPVEMLKMTGSLHDYEKLSAQLSKVGFFTALETLDLTLAKTYLNGTKYLIYAKDRAGISPLHAVLQYEPDGKMSDSTRKWMVAKRKSLLTFLLSKGADVGLKDDQGMVPLHYAALHGVELDTVKELFKGKVLAAIPLMVNVQDKQGNTPLHYAILQSSAYAGQLSTCIEQHKPDEAQKMLYLAQNNSALVAYLLELGALIEIKNKVNATPYSLALMASKDIYTLLSKRHEQIQDSASSCSCWSCFCCH